MGSRSIDFGLPGHPALIDSEEPLAWAMTGASTWFVGGLLIDGWAHNNLRTIDTFFTPWHAVLYSGYLAVALVVLIGICRNHARGASWRSAVPRGYELTLAGVILFPVAGFCDMLWHLMFGVESSISALLSPTHLLLATALSLIVLGPLRVAAAHGRSVSLAQLVRALIALTFFLCALLFMAQWNMWTLAGRGADPALLGIAGQPLSMFRQARLGMGLSGIIVRSALITGFMLYALRTFGPRAGMLTFLYASSAFLLAVMIRPQPLTVALLTVPAIVAGGFADLWSRRHAGLAPRSLLALGFGAPFVYWALFIAGTAFTRGLWWDVHTAYGASFLGGISGLLVALLLTTSGAHETPRSPE
ncbi:MAG TPA: hypothetical protein VGD50_04740 [Candidatus Baltobacteraceae bacterium]